MRLLFIVMLAVQITAAQTYDEWFRQKKTQLKYLTEQIAALQVYAGYVEKGYKIAKNGLDAIHAIKQGDFSLHDNYFSSLKKVNPAVKAYSKIAAIVAMQINIIKTCHQQKLNMSSSKQFNGNEISYAGTVFENVLNSCTDITDQLIVITTDGLLQMKDDERIERIDHLYNNMQDRLSFVQHFANENNMLAIQRMKDQNDVEVGKELYGVK
ncbi:hypothetical protein FW778_14210 [Ginsengibacter hankyongi]|uniref:TerB family tellurite resistance protein n=1 Tax=Ginsengibacter hankyongi TaxID=2607284 RepID=A0A5J5IIX2_9BACT|nr:hypothetical protein [Ginsengibacter hankyongi]KAA9038697.1 hypothetical protein FW778_14210 [Ginsengibacter hankyongi]